MNKLAKIIAQINCGVNVKNVAEYIAMPEPKRTRRSWGINWYIEPSSLSVKVGEGKIFSEWDTLNDFLKSSYPVQFFFRHDVDFFIRVKQRQLFDLWYPVACFFKPRNSNFAKLIPRNYKSAEEIIQDIIIEAFMSSVSPEDIELWKRDDYSEHWRTKGMEAEQCRYYFEFERVKIKAAINAAWDNLPEKADYKERYEELHKLENELDDGDTKWLAWIVANRKILD